MFFFVERASTVYEIMRECEHFFIPDKALSVGCQTRLIIDQY